MMVGSYRTQLLKVVRTFPLDPALERGAAQAAAEAEAKAAFPGLRANEHLHAAYEYGSANAEGADAYALPTRGFAVLETLEMLELKAGQSYVFPRSFVHRVIDDGAKRAAAEGDAPLLGGITLMITAPTNLKNTGLWHRADDDPLTNAGEEDVEKFTEEDIKFRLEIILECLKHGKLFPLQLKRVAVNKLFDWAAVHAELTALGGIGASQDFYCDADTCKKLYTKFYGAPPGR
jgi:hypothetical protein